MQEATADNGYVRREIPPDGNCLYRACAEICLGSQERSGEVRRAVASYLAQHRMRFEPFMDDSFEDYIARVGRDGHWGSDLELQAIAEMYDTHFTIYDANDQLDCVKIEPKPRVGQPLPRLAALWFSHGNHYDALYTREDFLRRGFGAENAELAAFRRRRDADEAKSLQLTRELSAGAHAGADWMLRGAGQQQGAIPNLMDEPVGAGQDELYAVQLSSTSLRGSQHLTGWLTDEQMQRPTVAHLLDAGFSEAVPARQLDSMEPLYLRGGGERWLPPEPL